VHFDIEFVTICNFKPAVVDAAVVVVVDAVVTGGPTTAKKQISH